MRREWSEVGRQIRDVLSANIFTLDLNDGFEIDPSVLSSVRRIFISDQTPDLQIFY